MSEKMSTGMEKLYFQHILENPEQFSKVDSYFFKNDDIQFVYKVVRDEYIISTKKEVPSLQQIFAMVRLNDPEKKIPDNLVKMILKGDNENYGKDWFEPRFKAWKISNLMRNNVMKSIEFIRGVDEINYDNVMTVANKIKSIYNEVNLIDDDDEDLGDDFDDPESHVINTTNKKMSSGWGCMDTLLNGGWDQASFVVFMAQTSGGKCSTGDTKITIRNKETGEIKEIKIENFYTNLTD